MLSASQQIDTKPNNNASRDSLIDAFISESSWRGAVREPLLADASFRRYERIRLGEHTAMLMDAPPPREDVRPFITVTRLLHRHALRAPEIFLQDVSAGLLLLEDLGVHSYTKWLKQHPSGEMQLYKAAVDVLIALRQAQPENLSHWREQLRPYALPELMREVTLFADWFLPQAIGREAALQEKPRFLNVWSELLERSMPEQSMLVLRDYHADNLMWLNNDNAAPQVGLLDYQDALLGDAAYDLVSLLEDARRDVGCDNAAQLLHYYIEETAEDAEAFRARYALLGAQRNMKIIGIFTRLCVCDQKPHYLYYLPRVWGHLQHDLTHVALADLAEWVDVVIPADKRGVLAVNAAIGSLEL